jgi:predicted porin
MKKTIIASAIAAVVAAPAAFADVTISGNVNMELLDQDASTGWDNSTNTDLVFSGSEDLGNGMKAGFKYHIFHDDGGAVCTDTTAATPAVAAQTAAGTVAAQTAASAVASTSSTCAADQVADTTVFLSGDFGTITAGRMETQNMAYFHGFAAGDAAHDMTLEDTNGQQGRGNAIMYTSPSFNGLSIGVQTVIDQGAATGTDTDNVDTTDLMVKYTNGPLTVAFGETTQKGSTDAEVQNIAVAYSMGDLTLKVLNRDVDNGVVAGSGSTANSGKNEMTTVSATYKMGSNTIYAGVTDSDDAQNDDWVISAAHNLSKRTSVYVSFKNDESDDNTDTLIGMKHSF